MTDFEALCITWHKSTASNSGGCVEMVIADESVLVRDSVNADGPVLRLSTAAARQHALPGWPLANDVNTQWPLPPAEPKAYDLADA